MYMNNIYFPNVYGLLDTPEVVDHNDPLITKKAKLTHEGLTSLKYKYILKASISSVISSWEQIWTVNPSRQAKFCLHLNNYAALLSAMCQKLGIESYYVIGTSNVTNRWTVNPSRQAKFCLHLKSFFKTREL